MREIDRFFRDEHRIISETDIWQLKKVVYANTRPRTTPVELDMTAILLTKHASWSHERE
jgi:hypothetical protein